jgi:hypothetical protein
LNIDKLGCRELLTDRVVIRGKSDQKLCKKSTDVYEAALKHFWELKIVDMYLVARGCSKQERVKDPPFKDKGFWVFTGTDDNLCCLNRKKVFDLIRKRDKKKFGRRSDWWVYRYFETRWLKPYAEVVNFNSRIRGRLSRAGFL